MQLTDKEFRELIIVHIFKGLKENIVLESEQLGV